MDSDLTTLERLCRGVALMLEVAEVDPDTGIGELGINSLNLAVMAIMCEVLYAGNVRLNDIALDVSTTLRSLDVQLAHPRDRRGD